ncbi:hypothetical protein L8R80_04195 [Vibrio splendidus]|uniref:hypothetical protein n=1 Tax=Vibrio splendidus TaxID=29497 RepID=UPI002468A089|nr:hypothetical protein [Vibrio splendidus]MDH5913834.1 hypothetical protein [Vibrio splendidus]MDH5940402.1 hypothetical protein [Vibrio splendidus]MDH5983832.1 hypothetical protein [Vibrio splendidus]MDH5992427.1 hypothetical protein [Vibrio splendidus]MDH6003587.1 hypothetical protein [Vibrio splendidus]
MNLLASLLTTVGITGAVWGALHIQPAVADESNEQLIKEVSTVKPSITKPIKAKPLVTRNTQPIASQATQTTYLQGLSKTIPLEDVPELWVDFYQNLKVNDEEVTKHQQQNQQQKLIVIYQNISSDFSEATIMIGFPTQQSKLNKNKPLIKLPNKAKGTLLLGKGEHTEQELAQAWEGIAILKEVDMVIEHHQLNQHGLPDSSELYVYYKNNQ